MTRDSRLVAELWPLILPKLDLWARNLSGGGVGGGGALTVQLVGTVTDDQAPQFLLRDGSRSLLGNLAVDTGVTIDGVDISAHAGNPAAHHDPVSAGNGIALAGQQVAVDLFATNPGLMFDGGKVRVQAGDGIQRTAGGVAVDGTVVRTSRVIATGNGLDGGGDLSADRTLALDLATDPGLEFTGGKVRVKAYDGITRDANGLSLTLAADPGLELVGTSPDKQVRVKVYDGITRDANGLSLTLAADPGLELVGTSPDKQVRVKVTSDIVRDAFGLSIWRSIEPVWLAAHRFNAMPTIDANLRFVGARSIITDGNNPLTLAPAGSGELVLNPGGTVTLAAGKELRTAAFADLITGIGGMRLWDRGGNLYQLTLGGLRADELYARTFVSDEIRIDRGAEYWSKSYGVVETAFVLPAIGSTVDVWFEDAASLSGDIFSVNDWLMLRTIDWGSGLTLSSVWFDVTLRVTASDGVRQRWRLRRQSGGTTGQTIRAGAVALDVGQSGQGWIHLSALNQDAGPFIQMGTWAGANPYTPANVTNRVRIGHLSGVAGYSTGKWGFATGNNLALTPASGFSGLTSEAGDGTRLYNTDIEMYSGDALHLSVRPADGIRILAPTPTMITGQGRHINWFHPTWGDGAGTVGWLGMAADGVESRGELYLRAANQREAKLAIVALTTGVGTVGPSIQLHHGPSAGIASRILYHADTAHEFYFQGFPRLTIGGSDPAIQFDMLNERNALARFSFRNSNTGFRQTDIRIGRGTNSQDLFIGTNYAGGQGAFIDNRSGGAFTYRYNGAARVTILTDGKFGLGTDNPQWMMHLRSGSGPNIYSGIGIIPKERDDADPSVITGNFAGGFAVEHAHLSGYPDASLLMNSGGFYFRTGSGANAPNNKVIITNGGSVLVGTSSESQPLVIDRTGGDMAVIRLQSNQTNNFSPVGGIEFLNHAVGSLIGSIRMYRQSINYNSYMAFFVRAGGAEYRAVTIDALGNLLVNTGITNESQLDVVSNSSTKRAARFFGAASQSQPILEVLDSGGIPRFAVWENDIITGLYTNINALGTIGAGWTNASLTADWSNTGGNWPNVSYNRFGSLVVIRGLVTTSIDRTAGAVIFTLPASFIPSGYRMAAVHSAGGVKRVDVRSDGQVALVDTLNSGQWLNLDIMFLR